MAWQGWEDYLPPAPAKPTAPAARPARRDRGARRGAKRVVVTPDRQVIEKALAVAAGVTGESFQSKREALVYVARLEQQDRGEIKGLTRQVRFALQGRRPDGLMEQVTSYIADFVFEEPNGDAWRTVVEDVKPKGGLREDSYLLKRKWFAVQYGIDIRETH